MREEIEAPFFPETKISGMVWQPVLLASDVQEFLIFLQIAQDYSCIYFGKERSGLPVLSVG